MRSAGDFEAVLSAGCRLTSPHFVLRAHPNAGPHARLGIIAGKKAAPRAVDRNRAKRLIREVFRTVAANIGAYDVAIQLRSNLRSELNAALREELGRLLESFTRRLS